MSWKGWILLLLVLVLAAVAKPSLRTGGDETEPPPVPASTLADLDSDARPAQAIPRTDVAQDQANELRRSADPDPASTLPSEQAPEVGQGADEPGSVSSPPAETPDVDARLENALNQASRSADELAQEKAKSAHLQETLAETLRLQADWEGAERQATAAAIAEFRRRIHDTGTMEHQIGVLEQQLKDEQAMSASEARDLATARAALALSAGQAAATADAQHALQASARDTEARLGQEQDRSASLAAELTKARATIADLQAHSSKPQADAGPVQISPDPAVNSGPVSKAPVADARALDPQIKPPPQPGAAEPPLPPERPAPVGERERQAQTARGWVPARTIGRAATESRHRPVHAKVETSDPNAITSSEFSDEGAYSMTMDDSHYDFSDLPAGRVSGAGIFDFGVQANTHPCPRRACSPNRRQPTHLARRLEPTHRVAERRRY